MIAYNEPFYKNPALLYLFSLDSEVTRRNSHYTLNRLCKILDPESDYNSFDWSSLNYQIVLTLRKKLVDDNFNKGSINTYISVIKGVCRECYSLGLMTYEANNKIQCIKRIKNQRFPSGRSLTPKEISNIIDKCFQQKTTTGIRNAAIVAIAYGAGLRALEIAGLKLNQLQNNGIRIVGKGNKERFNPLNPKTIDLLNPWLDIHPRTSEYMFLFLKKCGTPTNRKLSPMGVSDTFKRLRNSINHKSFTSHDLRRSYATNLLGSGVDVITVQKLMGHTNLETTLRYDYRGDEAKEAAIKRLPI